MRIGFLDNQICERGSTRQALQAIERIASGDIPTEDGGVYRDCTGENVIKNFDEVFIR